MNINWYPGHMQKARRLISENLKLVDIVIELLDARIPLSSMNPDFEVMFRDKTRIVVLNKSDLADEVRNREWLSWFGEKGINGIALNSLDQAYMKRMKSWLTGFCERKRKIFKEKKGIDKTIRAMVVGIPNTGKSAFINGIAGKNKAKTGNRPGVTRSKQWVRVNPYLEILDTPGLLWPKLKDRKVALHIAYTGCIEERILDLEEVAHNFLEEVKELYPDAICKRYGLDEIEGKGYEIMEKICIKRGWLGPGGVPDTLRGAKQILDEFRSGKMGRMTLELPPFC